MKLHFLSFKIVMIVEILIKPLIVMQISDSNFRISIYFSFINFVLPILIHLTLKYIRLPFEFLLNYQSIILNYSDLLVGCEHPRYFVILLYYYCLIVIYLLIKNWI